MRRLSLPSCYSKAHILKQVVVAYLTLIGPWLFDFHRVELYWLNVAVAFAFGSGKFGAAGS
jgi:hypothetical protein